MKQQLELFTATLITFPLERRADLVRHTVNTLDAMAEHSRQGWWTRHCLALADQLRGAGKCDSDIRADLQRFANAVSQEMARRRAPVRSGPGAA